jgi:hypothetical protein
VKKLSMISPSSDLFQPKNKYDPKLLKNNIANTNIATKGVCVGKPKIDVSTIATIGRHNIVLKK